MAKREFAKCRGCGADIEWARLNGRPHPFDVDPCGPDGSHMLVDRATEVTTLAVFVPVDQRTPDKRLVKSHFATCPQAASFRSRTK